MDISPYGFAAIAGLGGLYSAQALEKLKTVFEVLFAKVTDHSDPIGQTLTVSDAQPRHAAVGAPVTITGTGLSKVSRACFSSGVSAVLGAQSDTTLIVTVPAGAATGPITLFDTTGNSVNSPDFTVDS